MLNMMLVLQGLVGKPIQLFGGTNGWEIYVSARSKDLVIEEIGEDIIRTNTADSVQRFVRIDAIRSVSFERNNTTDDDSFRTRT